MKYFKKIAISLSKKSKIFRKFLRFIRRKRQEKIYQKYYNKYQVDNKMILFEVYDGRGYTCSPKAIYEHLITMKEFQDYKMVWAFQEPDKHQVKSFKNLIIVKTNTDEYYKYLASSKYLIVNAIIDEALAKKPEQIYVQCWHGTPLKRLRYDINVNGAVLNTIEEIRKRNDMDAIRFDYFLSPSKFCTEKFTSAFNLTALHKDNIIIEQGYPRNDGLFNRSVKDINEIKKKLGIPKGKKIIFYSPTFRDNQHKSGVGYTYNLSIDFSSLQKKFQDKYFILFRPHYYIANKIDLTEYKKFVKNVADYDEINDLYLVSDILITDYSSVFFDYANLGKPMLFYMYDLDDYKNNLRDFYIDLDELPGPIVTTQNDLEKELTNIDKNFPKYKKKYEKFNKKYNYLDDGNASERVIKEIFKEVL